MIPSCVASFLARVGQAIDLGVNLGDGADVDAAGAFVEAISAICFLAAPSSATLTVRSTSKFKFCKNC